MGAIANLIVVLNANDEVVARQAARRRRRSRRSRYLLYPPSCRNVFSSSRGKSRAAPKSTNYPGVAGQVGVDGVVEIVAPLGVEAVAAALRRVNSRTSFRSLSPITTARHAAPGRRRVGHLLDRPQKVVGAGVVNGVDRVKPQTVEPVRIDPQPDVVEDEVAHRVAAGVVVVQRPAPGRVVARR